MIHKWLDDGAKSSTAFLIDGERPVVCEELNQRSSLIARNLGANKSRRIAAALNKPVELITMLFAASAASRDLAVMSSSYSLAERYDAMAAAQADMLIDDGKFTELLQIQASEAFERSGDQHEAQLVILTSGTTGKPKAAIHRWCDLAAQVKRVPAKKRIWILLYPLNHFAGIQVFLHALLNGDQLVVPKSRTPLDVFAAMQANKVTHASGTPTFWRMFLAQIAAEDCNRLSLTHITLGGEIATAAVLAGLKRAFPEATISHVYATTEVGSCFSVSDGKPGFPAALLSAENRSVKLKVIDGELYVSSPHAMRGYAGFEQEKAPSWIATGDLVKILDDRVHFLGRKTETINVAGAKVHPLEIESILLEVEGVQTVRAYGQPNPVTGSLVAADVTLMAGFESDHVKQAIQQLCAARLDRHKRPRVIRFVDHLPVANEKLVRRSQS